MHVALITPPVAEPLTLAEVKLHCRVDSTYDDMLLQTLIGAARREAERLSGRTIPAATWLLTLDRFPLYDGSGPRLGETLGVGAWEYLEPRRIRLPFPPLVSVNSLTYVDTTGTTQLLSNDPTARYWVSKDREPGIIEPAYGQVWPTARYMADAVQVNFTAGWACTSVAAVISSGSQTVTPASMNGIVVGSNLTIDLGTAAEIVTVTAVASTTFTATFAQDRAAGANVRGVPDDILAGMKLLIGHWYTNRETVMAGIATPMPMAAMDLLMGSGYGGYP